MEKIRVLLCGAGGRMGREVAQTLWAAPDIALVAAIDLEEYAGQDLGRLCGQSEWGISVDTDLNAAMRKNQAQVLVDFTNGEAAGKHLLNALSHGVRVVIGTSGISRQVVDEAAAVARRKKIGAVLAPNFSLGAVLLMSFAARAAKYFDAAEIIELHHENKLDAPSGTALKTAELMSASRENALGKRNGAFRCFDTPQLKLEGARGGDLNGIRIHSVRLPGMLAHQEVLLGGVAETLRLVHNSTGRACFMPGVLLAVRRVMNLERMVEGLETLLEEPGK